MARRVGNLVVALAAAAAAKCEVLRSLEFQQHTAPKGVSELLGPVVSLVSEKAEVGDIKIRWDGELGLHRVGTHKIVAENSDGACFETIINVKDTDECTVRGAWVHKCDASATCRNLVGSYACECSPDYFAAEGALFGCGGFASTTQCCDAAEDKAACLAAFRCEPNRCSEVCAPTATCARSVVENGGRKAARYACACPPGQLGTGRRSGANSGCARVDACAKVTCPSKSSCVIDAGKASCQCDKGYTKLDDSCVDETRPTLKLKGSAYRGGVLVRTRLRPIGATVARQIPVLKVTRSNRVSVIESPN